MFAFYEFMQQSSLKGGITCAFLMLMIGSISIMLNGCGNVGSEAEGSQLFFAADRTLPEFQVFEPNLTIKLDELLHQDWIFEDWIGRTVSTTTPVHFVGHWVPEDAGDYNVRIAALLLDPQEPDNMEKAKIRLFAPGDKGSIEVGEQALTSGVEQFMQTYRVRDANFSIDMKLSGLNVGGKGESFLFTGLTESVRVRSMETEPFLGQIFAALGNQKTKNIVALVPLIPIPAYSDTHVNIGVSNRRVGGVYNSEEQASVLVWIMNPLSESVTSQVSFKAINSASSQVVLEGEVFSGKLSPYEILTKEVLLSDLLNGVYVIDVVANTASAETRIAIIPKQDDGKILDEGSTFGVNYFWQHIPWHTYQIELTAKAGMRWIRPWVDGENIWQTQEPKKGEFHFELLEIGLAQMEKYGLGYYNTLQVAPKWAGRPRGFAPAMDKLEDFENWFRTSISRFKDRICYWENWNEPNGPDWWDKDMESMEILPEYFELLGRQYRIMQEVAPEAKLVGPGLGGGITDVGNQEWGPYPKWLEGLGKLGGFEYLDEITLHPYNFGPAGPEVTRFNSHVQKIRDIVNKYPGGKDTVFTFTEVGYPAIWEDVNYGTSESSQADFLQRQYLISIARGDVSKILWFCMMDPHENRPGVSPGFNAYGLFYMGYIPKAAYAAMAGLAYILNNATGLGQIPIHDDGTWGAAFERNGTIIVALWRDTYHDATCKKVEVGVEELTISDMYGNMKKIQAEDGLVEVEISRSPIYLIGVDWQAFQIR